MAEFKVVIPEDLKREMDRAPFINLSEVARAAIRAQVTKVARLKAIAARSKLSEQDALELGAEITKGLHARYKELYPELQ
ncbi:MAG: hypothetical protein ACP5E9_09955 [Candidatus Methanospirareceae archaeon]